MSVTKDGDTGRWMSQIRVTDWTGKTIRKKKRGFATKKEALQWERDFISQSTGSLGMTFGDFIALYVKDMEHRLKPSTVASKKWLIDLKVTPFFKKIPLNEIKPTHVRQWQNSLTSYRDENGKPYTQTYLKCIHDGCDHPYHIQQLVIHAAASFDAPQLVQHDGELVTQRFVNPRIALYYHVLASQTAGNVVLFGQPGELDKGFDLCIFLR